MKLRHIQNGTNSPTINLFDTIGGLGIQGQQVANEIDYLINHQEVSEIVININSGGGSVFDGFSIVAAMRQAKNKGIRVVTNNEGIAASIAGIIFVSGSERNMVDYGKLMIHDPFFSGGAKVTAKQKRQLSSIKDSLVTILSNNSKVEEGEVSSLMAKETWMDIDEAEAKGFIDNKIKTKRDDLKNTTDALLIYNTVKFENQKHQFDMELENKIEELEGSLETTKNQVTELEGKNSELENKVEEVTNELTTAKNEAEENKTALELANKENEELKSKIANAVVNTAVEGGRIKKEKAEYFVNFAIENGVEELENILEGLGTPRVSLNEMVTGNTEDPNNKANWDYRRWETEDPKGLEEMRINNKTKFDKLYSDYYIKNKK